MTIDPTLLFRVSLGDGKAHADLAQLIWNGAVDDAQVVAFLRDGDDETRRAVAWAVDDVGRPPAALAYLIEAGVSDPVDAVRSHALAAATTYTGMSSERIAEFLGPFASDPSPRVRHFVRETLEGRGRADWKKHKEEWRKLNKDMSKHREAWDKRNAEMQNVPRPDVP